MIRSATIVALVLSGAAAAALSPEKVEFFEKKIRPVLAQECYQCHSVAGKKKGGLLLDSREGWKQGGSSGKVIIPGKADKSLLIQAIRHEDEDTKMPKNGAKLDAQVIRDFEAWVNMGAPDPRDKPPTPEQLSKETAWPAVLERRKQWWSFQPVAHPEVPAVKDAAWSAQDVDRFLLAKMETDKLHPAADAEPRTFFRRLNFVLTGLPPKPAEVDAFVADAAKNYDAAVAAATERLLASPHFGETWGRHWLDWLRYAETHGSEGDPGIPHAWRYRDYVVNALNADVPYAQLVREHIAGDLLEQPRINGGINESALGIGHYRMVMHGYTPTDALDEQATFTDNQIDTITKAFLGATVACARCHNHKFDAISQTDFYALFGIMTSSRPALIDVNTPERQKINCDKIVELKGRMRAALAEEWLKKIDSAISRLREWKQEIPKDGPLPMSPLDAWIRLGIVPEDKYEATWRALQAEWKLKQETDAAFRANTTVLKWDLRGDDVKQWHADGAGLRGPSLAGEFQLQAQGERILNNIYPAGIYSNLITDKHRAVLSSPEFLSEGGKLWMRVRGNGKAHVRYVVGNYPRSGLIFPKKDLENEIDEWIVWKVDYWKGDRMHVEFTTDADAPTETSHKERSWFGGAEIVYAKDEKVAPYALVGTPFAALCPDAPAPKSADGAMALYARELKRAIEDWRQNKCNDAQAELLGAFVRQEWLPTKAAELPACAPLLAEYRKLESEIPTPTRAPGLLEGFAADHALYTRGNHKQPGEIVPRRFLEALDARPYESGNARSGRRELAESFVAPNNPLTSRVIVNRLWHYIFGQGIVSTPDNFGRLGELPTHPELLDYLATRFQTDGGSLKKMIRLLVTSRTFRLSHLQSADAAQRDPQNKLLSHFSVRRLEAELIRDEMLTVSGKLDPAMGGGSHGDPNTNRRSIYVMVPRNSLNSFLCAFDFPPPSSTRGKRDTTNVPAQSLALMNGDLAQRLSGEWARRYVSDQSLTDDARVERMFSEAFGRAVTEPERKAALAFLHDVGEAKLDQNAMWQRLALVLFNTKEFIYVH